MVSGRGALGLMGAVAAGVLVLGASVAPTAQARISCAYAGPPDNVLTVRASGFASGVIRRAGDEIVVHEFLAPRRRCGGSTPSVLNTDTIQVILRENATANLNLRDGPFAPGATPETDGEPEIEVEFRGFIAQVSVSGTPGADEFQWLPGGAYGGLNLNPVTGDQDVDATLKGRYSFMVAAGAEGNDRIVPAGGARIPNPYGPGVFSQGGRGDDFLAAPASGAILQGGPGEDVLRGARSDDAIYAGEGSDRLFGAAGPDRLVGGRGRDLIVGGPGRDRVNAHDGRRDIVRCGAGRDHVRADRRDRLRGCEFIRP